VESRFPLWYPAYPKGSTAIEGFHPEAAGPRPPVVWGGAPMRFWQYTSSGKLPSYAGALDLNVFYGTAAELAALGVTKLGTEPPPPDPEPKPKVPPTKEQPISALLDYYKE
jgi:GH25 family lysozyme M1 (1,4-beta-N-acetylmuramidase)